MTRSILKNSFTCIIILCVIALCAQQTSADGRLFSPSGAKITPSPTFDPLPYQVSGVSISIGAIVLFLLVILSTIIGWLRFNR